LSDSCNTKPTARQLFGKITRLLTSLKDTSELMTDLAYSSLLLNSQELAEEVQRSGKYFDELHMEFERLVLSSGFKPDEANDFLGLLRLGMITGKIADAASEIAEVVLHGLEPHHVLKLVIDEAEETVVRVEVSKGSKLVGKKLKEAKIYQETGMRTLAIRRGTWWIRPRPETVIRSGDFLISSGYAEGEEDLRKLASGSS